MNNQIGILGASGFVGSALCERLYFEGRRDFLAFIHRSGNAWRLTRLGGLPIQTLDVTDKSQALAALRKCEVVVNCALGDDVAAMRGLQNVLDAARTVKLRKFVHLSSIAIYGSNPAPGSISESHPPDPGGNAYGALKLRQDEMVMKAHRSGVPSYIICPGNITGPYSFFARGLVERLRAAPLPLVDGGASPSNLIHVDNLVEAILAAIRTDRGAGERYFVNESRPVSWRELYADLAGLLGHTYAFIDVSRAAVLPYVQSQPPRRGLSTNLRVLLSSEFRDGLSTMPALGWVNNVAHSVFGALPDSVQRRAREHVKWPIRVPKAPDTRPPLNDRYVTVQVRQFYHSPEKLRSTLGWEPPLSYERGMETLAAWLTFAGITALRR